MHYVFVLPTAHLGGAERFIHTIATELSARDARSKVTVYVMSRGIQPGWGALSEQSNAVVIFREFPSEKTSLMSLALSLWRISRQERRSETVFFTSHTHVNAAVGLLRKLRVVRTSKHVMRESTEIFSRFSGWQLSVFRALYAIGYGQQDLLICQTEAMRAAMKANLSPRLLRRLCVVPNPLSDARSGLSADKAGDQGALSSDRPRRPVRLVSCGRLAHVKGVDILIEAFSAITITSPPCELEIIGDGPERPALVELVARLGLENRVTFHGRLDSPFALFRSADIGVISSRQEGFPNVLLEMMSVGVPSIVVTPCAGGLAEIPGLRVAADVSADALAEQLTDAMRSVGESRAMQYQRYIADHHTASKIVEQIERAANI